MNRILKRWAHPLLTDGASGNSPLQPQTQGMLEHEVSPCSSLWLLSAFSQKPLHRSILLILPRVGADTWVGMWSQRCGWVALPSNMHLQSLQGCHLAWKRIRDKWNRAGISSYKRSHSELHALLHNKGTRRCFRPVKGPERKIKGHDFLSFVFWVFRPVLSDARLWK